MRGRDVDAQSGEPQYPVVPFFPHQWHSACSMQTNALSTKRRMNPENLETYVILTSVRLVTINVYNSYLTKLYFLLGKNTTGESVVLT